MFAKSWGKIEAPAAEYVASMICVKSMISLIFGKKNKENETRLWQIIYDMLSIYYYLGFLRLLKIYSGFPPRPPSPRLAERPFYLILSEDWRLRLSNKKR